MISAALGASLTPKADVQRHCWLEKEAKTALPAKHAVKAQGCPEQRETCRLQSDHE